MRVGPGLYIALLSGGLLLAIAWHVSVGARPLPLAEVWAAFTAPDPESFDHVVVRDLRLPRALSAAAAGAMLAVAGALMQGVTRNPLAEPGTLGLMAGSASAVVLGIGWFGLAGTVWIPLFAASGAVAAAALVWLIATAVAGGARPLTLVLAGAAVTAFLTALVNAAILFDEQAFRTLRVWLVGSFAGADLATLARVAPWGIAGMLIALVIARPLTALSLGDDVAKGLGLRVERVRVAGLAAAVMLTAGAVSVAGILGFVGLVIPHAVRLVTGPDVARVVPLSALTGAAYVTLVDVAARIVLAPVEVASGLMTALLGAPVFLWLVRVKA